MVLTIMWFITPTPPRPKKNTESFVPSHNPPEMRLLFAPPGRVLYERDYSTRDVVMVMDLFGSDPSDLSLYDRNELCSNRMHYITNN